MVKFGVLFEVRTEFLNNIYTSFVFKGLTFMLRILEVPVSNRGPETGYPDRFLVVSFSLFIKCWDTVLN
jgi:hypothetical protein